MLKRFYTKNSILSLKYVNSFKIFSNFNHFFSTVTQNPVKSKEKPDIRMNKFSKHRGNRSKEEFEQYQEEKFKTTPLHKKRFLENKDFFVKLRDLKLKGLSFTKLIEENIPQMQMNFLDCSELLNILIKIKYRNPKIVRSLYQNNYKMMCSLDLMHLHYMVYYFFKILKFNQEIDYYTEFNEMRQTFTHKILSGHINNLESRSIKPILAAFVLSERNDPKRTYITDDRFIPIFLNAFLKSSRSIAFKGKMFIVSDIITLFKYNINKIDCEEELKEKLRLSVLIFINDFRKENMNDINTISAIEICRIFGNTLLALKSDWKLLSEIIEMNQNEVENNLSFFLKFTEFYLDYPEGMNYVLFEKIYIRKNENSLNEFKINLFKKLVVNMFKLKQNNEEKIFENIWANLIKDTNYYLNRNEEKNDIEYFLKIFEVFIACVENDYFPPKLVTSTFTNFENSKLLNNLFMQNDEENISHLMQFLKQAYFLYYNSINSDNSGYKYDNKKMEKIAIQLTKLPIEFSKIEHLFYLSKLHTKINENYLNDIVQLIYTESDIMDIVKKCGDIEYLLIKPIFEVDQNGQNKLTNMLEEFLNKNMQASDLEDQEVANLKNIYDYLTQENIKINNLEKLNEYLKVLS